MTDGGKVATLIGGAVALVALGRWLWRQVTTPQREDRTAPDPEETMETSVDD